VGQRLMMDLITKGARGLVKLSKLICVHLWFDCFLATGVVGGGTVVSLEPQMHTDKAALTDVSGKSIGCAFVVLNTLGVGSLEKVYENALVHGLKKAGLMVEQQCDVAVHYDSVVVGAYTADPLVENNVLVELKAVNGLDAIHRAQCMNYLKATGLRLCLLLNFGHSRLEIKRLING
jgi:GxxExxY protein